MSDDKGWLSTFLWMKAIDNICDSSKNTKMPRVESKTLGTICMVALGFAATCTLIKFGYDAAYDFVQPRHAKASVWVAAVNDAPECKAKFWKAAASEVFTNTESGSHFHSNKTVMCEGKKVYIECTGSTSIMPSDGAKVKCHDVGLDTFQL